MEASWGGGKKIGQSAELILIGAREIGHARGRSTAAETRVCPPSTVPNTMWGDTARVFVEKGTRVGAIGHAPRPQLYAR